MFLCSLRLTDLKKIISKNSRVGYTPGRTCRSWECYQALNLNSCLGIKTKTVPALEGRDLNVYTLYIITVRYWKESKGASIMPKIPEIKWNFFLLTGIFGITSGGGALISVGIFRPKFVVPFLTNRFFALIREFGRETNSGKSHSYWLARFNRKMSFHFAR